MNTLYLLCGPAGCGKSTWASRQQGAVIVSRDEIRFSLVSENEEYFSREREVFNIYAQTINKEITEDNQKIVIADATHLTPKSRQKILSKLNLKNTKVVAMNFIIPKVTTENRNNLREGRKKVPQNVIDKMYKDFDVASTEEPFIDYVNWVFD